MSAAPAVIAPVEAAPSAPGACEDTARRPPVPGSPADVLARVGRRTGKAGEYVWIGLILVALAVFFSGAAFLPVFRLLRELGTAAEDPADSSSAKGVLFVLVVAAVVLGANWWLGRALTAAWAPADVRALPARLVRILESISAVRTPKAARVGAVLAAAALTLWAFPVLHGILILLYAYPLVTWLPLLVSVGVIGLGVLAGVALREDWRRGARVALAWRTPAMLLAWTLAMAALPALQGHALYAATTYREGGRLPASTQPRLLPKEAAVAYGATSDVRDTHLVVDPSSGALEYSGELKAGDTPRGGSRGIVVQPLDRVDGSRRVLPAGFRTAVSSVGPGSLSWRAYRRHPFSLLLDRVLVPLDGRRAVAVAAYIGFRGFPVRRPFWQGVYVLHQDGRLEDLTPGEAIARPELVRSGHVFPERLARAIADAYGDKSVRLGFPAHRRTVVSDPKGDQTGFAGNRQPYLTNVGDGQVKWVSVAHAPGEDDDVTAVFLTDGVTGRTDVWHAPPRAPVLSNQGALALAQRLPLQWSTTDSDGDTVALRRATEPRPVFARGQLYYLVSILPENGLRTAHGVDRTVLVDALRHRIVRVFNHADPEADDALRAFFAGR